ncbi:intracellular ribonuclease LX-like [Impatiens glandulifera]|uniref:intracellular ribonuclease LX-like n=1 Tax=Impatiens glandulifera TaxID=253017 RepID=UPI001FB1986E|nr:intracellular ribonuclease LX-like [Impatiens glandulifera]
MKKILLKILLIQCILVLSAAKTTRKTGYDFFYFVQQWPGAYCDSRQSCCYPKTGKPVEDFSIHGLWPNFNDGSYPQNCDFTQEFDDSQISDLITRMQEDWPTLACPSGDGIKFWSHEWSKHGTCSQKVLDQHSYFEKALQFKTTSNLLQHLQTAGIRPDNGFYSLDNIQDAIKEGLGVTPFIDCNVDTDRNKQLYQVYLCVDKSASRFIECPVMPHGRACGNNVQFQSFSESSSEDDDDNNNDEL